MSTNHQKRPKQPQKIRPEQRHSPKGDRRPTWWRHLASRLDLAGQLAERLETRWQRWWVPVVLLSLPILLLLLALAINTLR